MLTPVLPRQLAEDQLIALLKMHMLSSYNVLVAVITLHLLAVFCRLITFHGQYVQGHVVLT